MTKIINLFKIITFLLFLLLPISSFSQSNRSIDNEKYMKSQRSRKYRPTREERVAARIEKATIKKEKKKKRRDYRLHKKAVKKHNKKINGGGKDLVGNKRTWRRMKKSKRQAKYQSR